MRIVIDNLSLPDLLEEVGKLREGEGLTLFTEDENPLTEHCATLVAVLTEGHTLDLVGFSDDAKRRIFEVRIASTLYPFRNGLMKVCKTFAEFLRL